MTDTTLENMRLAHEALMTQFREHTETIQILQHRLRNDILPGVLDELRVPDGLAFEEERRARDWINDSGECRSDCNNTDAPNTFIWV